VTVRGFRVRAAALTIAASAILPTAPANADSIRGDQWHLKYLKISSAQVISKGAGVTVAVVDTGVYRHPDLRKNLLTGGSVIPGDKANSGDQEGHGTGMAGLIAAHGRDGHDSALGVAPAAKVLPVKMQKPGDPSGALDIAAGIEWAVAHGADVINVSAAAGPSIALDDAVKAATENDIVVVAGAGNAGQTHGFGYPARIPAVLAVGAIDRSGKHAKFSLSGNQMGICAPGVDITSTGLNGRYRTSFGTSPATAIVSGAAALVRAKFPELSAPEVIHRLQATATDNGKPGRDDDCGFGVLNVVKALTADVPPLAGGSTESAAPTAAPTTAAPAATTAPAAGSGSGSAAPDTTPASTNTPAIVGGGVIVLLLGGLIALLVNRRRKSPPPT
jgi:type VII secretion-associated serine protease mycosin